MQEHFQSLNLITKWAKLQPFHKWVLIFHIQNLNQGLQCTGFSEDDPMPENAIKALPKEFPTSNEFLQFRYRHESEPETKFVFTFLNSENKIQVQAASSRNEDMIFSYELRIQELDDEIFDDLPAFVEKEEKFNQKYLSETVEKF